MTLTQIRTPRGSKQSLTLYESLRKELKEVFDSVAEGTYFKSYVVFTRLMRENKISQKEFNVIMFYQREEKIALKKITQDRNLPE
jgi:hypothetical protein